MPNVELVIVVVVVDALVVCQITPLTSTGRDVSHTRQPIYPSTTGRKEGRKDELDGVRGSANSHAGAGRALQRAAAAASAFLGHV